METERTSERIVLLIPVCFSADELAGFCCIQPDSPAYEEVEDALPLVNQWAAPKAILKWVEVDSVAGDETVIEGHTFRSRVVADKLRNMPRVFLSVVTAGTGLEQCEELADKPFLDLYNGALIRYATDYLVSYMKENFGFDGFSMLSPGSLPDWPIENNFPLFEIIGNTEEIGMSLNSSGYIKPWNSGSHIHFSGDRYHNCSLCRKWKCISRKAAFDRDEYIRIFGIEP